MRKASMILGIVGGTIAILTAIALVFISLFVGAVSTTSSFAMDEGVVIVKDIDIDEIMDKDAGKDVVIVKDIYLDEECPYENDEDCPYENDEECPYEDDEDCPYENDEDCPYEDDEDCPLAAKLAKDDDGKRGWRRGGMMGGGMWRDFDDKDFGPHEFSSSRYGDMGSRFAIGLLWFIAAASFAGGVLGIVGGSIAKRKSAAGGVLMIVGALLASNVFAILLTGGILALVSGRNKPDGDNEEPPK